uniref:Uncharacterized protein n=1 Tax=Manihot esculenta TaxID=3983 RepID=A0A2C9VBU2_MANES
MASLGFIVIGIAVSVRKTFSRVVKKKSTENYKSALYVTSLLGYKFVDFLWIHEPRRFACGDCECDWCCFPVHLCHTFSHLRSQPRIKSSSSRSLHLTNFRLCSPTATNAPPFDDPPQFAQLPRNPSLPNRKTHFLGALLFVDFRIVPLELAERCCSRLGIREPISLGGPIEYDEIKTRKLKEVYLWFCSLCFSLL